MRIGELAAGGGVSAKTVRYYESIGLLAAPERTGSNYRDYGVPAIERLRFIRDSQAAGLTLAEVGSILDMKDAGKSTCGHTRDLLHRHLLDGFRTLGGIGVSAVLTFLDAEHLELLSLVSGLSADRLRAVRRGRASSRTGGPSPR